MGQLFSQRVSEVENSSESRYRNAVQQILMYFEDFFEVLPNVFSEDDILEYEVLTYLTRNQILKLYHQFFQKGPEYLEGRKNPYLSVAKVLEMPQFCANPFSDRLLKVFCTYGDYLTFEDYLDMMSVFSPQAPLELKAEYAFRIYDFNEDDLLCMEDLEELLRRLTVDEFLEEEKRRILVSVMDDVDIDGDGYIAFTEFLHALQNISSDFMSSFVMPV